MEPFSSLVNLVATSSNRALLFHQIPFAIVVSIFIISFSKLTYRLFLHPLSRFPGPWLAAATNMYCGYYDVVNAGSMVRRLPQLHERYGPVVRIAPDELHVFDFASYNEIFKVGTHYSKPRISPTDTFSSSFLHISSPQKAKARKDAYTPYFSPAAIRRLEPLLRDILCRWTNQLHLQSSHGDVIDLSRAIKCFALDVVTQYSFSQDVGGVSATGFVHPLIEASTALDNAFTFSKYFPGLKAIMDGIVSVLPAWVARKVLPGAVDLKEYISSCHEHIASLRHNPRPTNPGIPTVFDSVLDQKCNPNKLSLSHKLLTADAVLMVSAGMSTTSYAAQVGCWHLVNNPGAAEKLVRELQQRFPGLKNFLEQSSLTELEQLPYLRAIIKESLRLSYGVPGPMTRVVPGEGAVVSGWHVPPGTLISHSTYLYHHDERIFPDSSTFKPERWMGPDVAVLERHLLSFSKGSRSCLGINLAYAELALVFALLFRSFELVNVGTTSRDMEWCDRFVPISNGSLKVRLEMAKE